MKALYLFLALLLTSASFSASLYGATETRLDSADQQELIVQLKDGLEEFKQNNNGEIDFQKLKPLLADTIGDFYNARLVTIAELITFEKQYDAVAIKYLNSPTAEKEAAIIALFESAFKQIANSILPKLKEGDVCNNWNCMEGLFCAVEPMRLVTQSSTCAGGRQSCSNNNQCCSGKCDLSTTGTGSCQPVMRCFAPVALNQSCYNSPICTNGSCVQVDWENSGINECKPRASACKSNVITLFAPAVVNKSAINLADTGTLGASLRSCRA